MLSFAKMAQQEPVRMQFIVNKMAEVDLLEQRVTQLYTEMLQYLEESQRLYHVRRQNTATITRDARRYRDGERARDLDERFGNLTRRVVRVVRVHPYVPPANRRRRAPQQAQPDSSRSD